MAKVVHPHQLASAVVVMVEHFKLNMTNQHSYQQDHETKYGLCLETENKGLVLALTLTVMAV